MSEASCLLYRDGAGLIRAAVMADAPLAVQCAREAARSGWTRTEYDLADARTALRREGTWYTSQARPPQPQPFLF